jgi:hypothetical protein
MVGMELGSLLAEQWLHAGPHFAPSTGNSILR